MKTRFTITLITLLALGASLPAADEPVPNKPENFSFRNEIKIAIDKGLAWLQANQKADGSWSGPDHPALTCLPLLAFHREPTGLYATKKPGFLQKGYGFIRSHIQPDGGIYNKGLSNYNTSLGLMALLTSGDPKDEPSILKAREFVVAQQAKGMAKPELDGGIGYGPTGVSPKRMHPDLDNTLVALEALRNFRAARPAVEIPAGKDLDWDAAIGFLSRCQNLTASNQEPWASDDPANKGGFIYYPGYSNAGEQPLESGGKALRSYGSMSYGGLLSFIYADLKKDDPRVAAALDWLRKNYTLEENPGMGRQGLYYYYHLATKGLAAANIAMLESAGGGKIDWAREIGLKLLNLQNNDGSWVNDTGRWMEKDPVLVTCYAVLSLEIIYHRL
ncbi:MAG: terpene cyclase/mutase family protein [Verrucomicrobiota bacterium]|nr:terpene cyclase/mutase family protein [Verrucomicrobiota bacterium]